MKTTMHQFFHYVGRDEHFTNANLMMLIVLVAGVILGMILTWVVQTLANKTHSNGKYSGSLDDLVDSVNGVRGWKPKSHKK